MAKVILISQWGELPPHSRLFGIRILSFNLELGFRDVCTLYLHELLMSASNANNSMMPKQWHPL